MRLLISILLVTISTHTIYCNNDVRYFDCVVQLKNDLLTVENSKINTPRPDFINRGRAGGSFTAVADDSGKISLSLKNKNSYALYKYQNGKMNKIKCNDQEENF